MRPTSATFGLAALCVLLGAGPSFASLDESFTAEERAVLAELQAGKLIKAREAAAKLLLAQPSSFVGTWAMARVHHDEEGNHARALYYLKRAQALLGRQDKVWSRTLLLEEYDILTEMARDEEALESLTRYEQLLGPAPAHLRIWPLLRLGRYQESTEIARRLSESSDAEDRAYGLNGLLALASRQDEREQAYRFGKAGVRATNERDCVLLRNTGNAASKSFRPREAEELWLKASKQRTGNCMESPMSNLASLYVSMGEPQKALTALRDARTWPVEKRYRPQFALSVHESMCELLEVLGKEVEAAKLATELYRQQRRTGMTSGSKAGEQLGRTLQYAFALEGHIARLKEKASYLQVTKGVGSALPELAPLAAARWEAHRTLVKLFSEGRTLMSWVRPNLDGDAWRAAELASIVGSGVLRSTLDEGRVLDAEYPQARAYYDAIEGELSFRSGNLARAVTLARSALEGLPREEALLRLRTQAWLAEVLWRLDRRDEAGVEYREVMRRWPTALRKLGLSLPVVLSTDGSAPAEDAASGLRRSSRFDLEDGAPFRLRVDSQGETVTVCLTDGAGSRFSCASGKGAPAALEAFHAAAFSPAVTLTESDLNSLDGSPTRVSADDALRQVLQP